MNDTKNLLLQLEQGSLDAHLERIYVDGALVDYQRNRYVQAVETFESTFGYGTVTIYSAPGRSEVCGNHTDHQHGKVLAAAVNLDAIAVVSPRKDCTIRLLSEGYPMIEVDLGDLEASPSEKGTSVSLVRGMASQFRERGYGIGGFSAYVTSDVLNGAGLSSSAAFEVLVGTIFSGEYNERKVDPIEIAKMAQYAENVFFGKPCGLMDQMACAVGGLISIDFESPENPHVERVYVDFSAYGYRLCITDTKGSHANLTDEYAAVPKEMGEVADYFGKNFLREVEPKEFFENISGIREKVGDRPVLRTLHFFEEEERVDGIVGALKAKEFDVFLKLIEKSGDSSYKYLQNVFTAKDVQHQAVSMGLAVSEYVLGGGRGVCRVHGGGFAGTIQAFVKYDFVEEYCKVMDDLFGEGSCHVLNIRPFGGIKVI